MEDWEGRVVFLIQILLIFGARRKNTSFITLHVLLNHVLLI